MAGWLQTGRAMSNFMVLLVLKLVLVQLSKDKDTKVEEDNWGATLLCRDQTTSNIISLTGGLSTFEGFTLMRRHLLQSHLFNLANNRTFSKEI